MTHDELLAKLNSSQVFGKKFGAKAYLALYAIVKLHKPDTIGSCEGCGKDYASDLVNLYPCPTIQAIEKEIT